MSAPRCFWVPPTTVPNKQAKFVFQQGGLPCTITGPGAPTNTFVVEQYPSSQTVLTSFASTGSYTWIVTNDDGLCSSTLHIYHG